MGNNHSDGDWIGIIICYIIFWPLGLFLLLRKLLKGKLRAPKRKTALLIGGALAIWGLYQLQLMGQADSVHWEEIMSSVFYVLGGGFLPPWAAGQTSRSGYIGNTATSSPGIPI